MQLIRQPNRWTCLPTAVAMAAGVTLEYVLDQIGHDGSEIVFPDLREPLCRRSFHIEECLTAVSDIYGFVPLSVTRNHGIDEDHVVSVQPDLSVLHHSFGIALGEGVRNLHAVAFKHTVFYDPNGLCYSYDNPFFKPSQFWLFRNS